MDADLTEDLLFDAEEELAELWLADVLALMAEEVLSLIDATEEARLAAEVEPLVEADEAILVVEEETLLEADEARTATLDVEEEDLAEVDEESDVVLIDELWDPEDTGKAELVLAAAMLDDPDPKEPPGPPPILPLGADPMD